MQTRVTGVLLCLCLVVAGSRTVAGQATPLAPQAAAFVASAAAVGVQQADITRAMLEGRFVPSWEDFHKVAVSLGQDSSIMTREWNRLFGALSAVGRVRTFQNGKWMDLTARDLLYQRYMDSTDGYLLHQSTKLDPTAHPTYAEAMAFLGQYGPALQAMERWAESRTPSLWDYFNNGQYTQFRNRRVDYNALADFHSEVRAFREGKQKAVHAIGALLPPVRTKYVEPTYPAIAQAARVTGTWILDVIIGPDGKVQSVVPIRFIGEVGGPLLEAASREAVAQWEYVPTEVFGQPVPVAMTVTVWFDLR